MTDQDIAGVLITAAGLLAYFILRSWAECYFRKDKDGRN